MEEAGIRWDGSRAVLDFLSDHWDGGRLSVRWVKWWWGVHQAADDLRWDDKIFAAEKLTTWAEELSDDPYGQRQIRAVETYLSLAMWKTEDEIEGRLVRLFHANRVYEREVLLVAMEQYRYQPTLIRFVSVLNDIWK